MSNYANILKQSNKQQVTTNVTRDEGNRTVSDDVKPHTGRRLVVNYIPPRGNSSYDSWEFSYFRELIQLRNLFVDNMEEWYPHLVDHMKSPQFFYKFCHFIHENSSGYISPYLEEMNEAEEEDFWFYTLKKKEL